VVDPAGEGIRWARVQVQLRGSDIILRDIEAGRKGRFHLPLLKPGRYWLGVSAPGFNLHVWELELRDHAGTKALRVELSLGT
jgi:hypothetical protein